VGAPTSAILAEIFLQCSEHTQTIKILTKHHISGYLRYVDDILTVYNPQDTETENTITLFNSLHPDLNLTMEVETLVVH
jgi:hypothetical protein